MKFYTFDRVDIDKDFQSKIAEILNTGEDKIIIYFSSDGGCVNIADTIADMFNLNKERVILIAYDCLNSSAFRLFMKVQCFKRIMPETYGMYRLPRLTLEINLNGKGYSELSRFLLETKMPKEVEIEMERVKKWGFNDEELDKFKNGEDVFITYDRFCELLKHN